MPNREQDQRRSQPSQSSDVRSASPQRNERSDLNDKETDKETDKEKRTQRSEQSNSDRDNFNK